MYRSRSMWCRKQQFSTLACWSCSEMSEIMRCPVMLSVLFCTAQSCGMCLLTSSTVVSSNARYALKSEQVPSCSWIGKSIGMWRARSRRLIIIKQTLKRPAYKVLVSYTHTHTHTLHAHARTHTHTHGIHTRARAHTLTHCIHTRVCTHTHTRHTHTRANAHTHTHTQAARAHIRTRARARVSGDVQEYVVIHTDLSVAVHLPENFNIAISVYDWINWVNKSTKPRLHWYKV